MFNHIFLPNQWLEFFLKDLSWKIPTCGGKIFQENTSFDSSIKILILGIFQNLSKKFDSSRLLNSCFSFNATLISFAKVPFQNLKFVEQVFF